MSIFIVPHAVAERPAAIITTETRGAEYPRIRSAERLAGGGLLLWGRRQMAGASCGSG